MKGLTDRQREVLDFIVDFTKVQGYPPTVREIGDHFDISLRAVQDHIAACQKKGFLTQCQKRSRSIRVLNEDEFREKQPFVSKIPLLGNVAAGKPLLSEENLDGYISIAEPMVKPGKTYFALHIRGTSMINAGILDGDIAIIEQAEVAAEGQIVVAMVENAITLKRFYREADRIRLQPENPDFQPIYATNVQIAGIMVGLVRSY